jgi:hypothetical protein
MPDARWMLVVMSQRQQSGWQGGAERPPYADIDAEPLPAEPLRERAGLSSRLTFRLRTFMRTLSRAEGALR